MWWQRLRSPTSCQLHSGSSRELVVWFQSRSKGLGTRGASELRPSPHLRAQAPWCWCPRAAQARAEFSVCQFKCSSLPERPSQTHWLSGHLFAQSSWCLTWTITKAEWEAWLEWRSKTMLEPVFEDVITLGHLVPAEWPRPLKYWTWFIWSEKRKQATSEIHCVDFGQLLWDYVLYSIYKIPGTHWMFSEGSQISLNLSCALLPLGSLGIEHCKLNHHSSTFTFRIKNFCSYWKEHPYAWTFIIRQSPAFIHQ